MATHFGTLPARLAHFVERHPRAEKIVLVPRTQQTRSLEQALARRGVSTAGLRITTPLHLAQSLAHWEILASGRRELTPDGLAVFAAHLMAETDGEVFGVERAGLHHFAATVGEGLKTLRLQEVPPEAVRERAEREDASAAFRVIASCYEKYSALLENDSLYDDASVYAWAAEVVREGADRLLDRAVVAISDETPLPECVFRFVDALRVRSETFVRLGSADPERAPAQSAAALFPEAATLEVESASAPAPRLTRAIGMENEVRAVFRDMLEAGHSFDEVELAAPDPSNYLTLIADVAEQFEVPCTFSTGLPALQTRTGQALRGFYEWIASGFEVTLLVRMLRSGLIRLDRWERSEAPVEPHRIASTLTGQRYPVAKNAFEAKTALLDVLEVRLAEAKRELERREDAGVGAGGAERRHRELLRTREFVRALFDRIPASTTSVAEFARASARFLETFGPVDPSSGRAEEERTLEEAARVVLYDKLTAWQTLPVSYEAGATRIARLFSDAIAQQLVQSAAPQEGRVHVSVLESVGYTGREHLYVVGMDSDTISWSSQEDVMLRDADLEAFADDHDGGVRRNATAADEAMWRVETALARHRGTLALYTTAFDVEKGEERFPSALYMERDGEEERLVGFLPQEAEVLFDERQAWLESYLAARRGEVPESETAREVLTGRFPWIARAEAARQAMASELYTNHDGLLSRPPYPELDFTDSEYQGPPMSANRLQLLASAPYLYFLNYVLGVRPLEEPALDEAAWLDPLRRGSLLHATYEQFMKRLDGRRPEASDEVLLMEILDERLEREKQVLAPPSDRVYDAARRGLVADARIFLQAEVSDEETRKSTHFEVGFGFPPHRRMEGDLGDVALPIGEEREVRLRGRIDRVDQLRDGTLAIWDYKTGSAKSYDMADPLQEGAMLQWALYAQVLERTEGRPVSRSGYYFPTRKEMGLRIGFDPHPVEQEVQQILQRLGARARDGDFAVSTDLHKHNDWKYRGYQRIYPDLGARKDQLKSKERPRDGLDESDG